MTESATTSAQGPRFVPCASGVSAELDLALSRVTAAPGWDALPPLAEGRRASVSLLTCGETTLAVKRYTDRRGFLLRTFLRSSRAQREAKAMLLVAEAWPENPVRVVGWAARRVLGFVPQCWIATTYFGGSFDLRRLRTMEPAERAATFALLVQRLPGVLARVHAHGVFARSLRGKNVLLNPSTEQVALIDLPYAVRCARVSVRQRAYDLASLWTELRHTIDEATWAAFLERYLGQAGLAPEEAAELTPAALALVSARLQHKTPLASWSSRGKRWFRHTRLGQLITGFRYPKRTG
ncbi:MAG: hypothetical protein KDD82_01305 [Planctomycetes bacterium]|nr:hypothetical protein [Planctomycetota bacterium]